MVKRVKIKQDELREVYQVLAGRGMTLAEISDVIGSEFRNHLYKGTSFTENSFRRLEELYGGDIAGRDITYVNGVGEVSGTPLEQSATLAELVGIILGDGHLESFQRKDPDRYVGTYCVAVTLHSEETRIIERTTSLMQQVLRKDPVLQPSNNSQAIQIRVFGKQVVRQLEEIGLVRGSKVEQQVGVPDWITKDPEFERRCLAGLVDTDGSIYQRNHDGYYVIHFKNYSKPLLEDFREMCSDLKIRTSKAGDKGVQIAAQEEVKKFVREVNPIKSRKFDALRPSKHT